MNPSAPATHSHGLFRTLRRGPSLPPRAAELDEERRVFYVGVTRACDELLIASLGAPSPFAAEVAAHFDRAA